MNKKIEKDKITSKEIDSCAEQFAEILVALIDEKESNKKKNLPNKSDSNM
jgi:hypothetical protein